MKLSFLLATALPFLAAAQPFQFPTANRHLLDVSQLEKFFVGTVGKPWTSGDFGCVRTGGAQMHEGIDIRCLRRDKRSEPLDTVHAAAAGSVAYINAKPSLSNYGNYLILRHQIEGLEIYTLYAHLASITSGLKVGATVQSGEVIGVMGRTTNTREQISKERAHLHFEINLFVNDRFAGWYKAQHPGQRNDHGDWNGQNLLGLSPSKLLLAQQRLGTKFSLLEHVRSQPELCRVFVRDTDFPWLRRHPALVRDNPRAKTEGIAGYEIALNYNGVPFELIPRAASEIQGTGKSQLLSVNQAEFERAGCRRLVFKKGSKWILTASGENLLSLLTH